MSTVDVLKSDGSIVAVDRATQFPEPSLDAQKTAKLQTVDDLLSDKFVEGFSYDFGGAIGVKTLQTRNSTDRTNWLTAKALYTDAILSGQGATVGATIRAEDNSTITVSFDDAAAMIRAMGMHGAALNKRAWDLKDQIKATATQSELDAIDITTGWP